MADFRTKNKVRISIGLHCYQDSLLNKMVEAGMSFSKGEVIRKLIDRYLDDYFKMLKIYEILTPEQIKILGD